MFTNSHVASKIQVVMSKTSRKCDVSCKLEYQPFPFPQVNVKFSCQLFPVEIVSKITILTSKTGHIRYTKPFPKCSSLSVYS